MSLNLAFGPITLAADANRDFGPHTIAAGETEATLSLQRDITNGINSVPAASIDLTFFYSTDNGTTWILLAKAGIPGGTITVTERGGGSHTLVVSTVQVGLDLVQGLPVKANVALHGGPVAVQGTFAVT